MKGFIEVHWKKDGTKCLCNLQHIRSVEYNWIMPDNDTPFPCEESYEEIKKLIEEAL